MWNGNLSSMCKTIYDQSKIKTLKAMIINVSMNMKLLNTKVTSSSTFLFNLSLFLNE